MKTSNIIFKKISQVSIEYFPYILVAILILFPLFLKPGYILLTDFVFGPNIDIDWKDGWFVINIILKTLSHILSPALVEKIFFVVILLSVLLGGRSLARYFSSDRYIVFAISLFSLFNPFIYDRLMFGQVGVVIAFGMFLFSMSCLLRYLDTRKQKELIYFGIYSGVGILLAAQFVFFFCTIFILFLILYFKKWRTVYYKEFGKFIFLSFLICLLININWLFVNIIYQDQALDFTSSGISDYDFLAFRTIGDSNRDVISNIFQMTGFWGKDQYRYIDLTTLEKNWGRSFMILTPLLIYGFIVGLRKKDTKWLTVGLGFIFIISIILASGISTSYFRSITHWLFEHVTIYKGLRETQKWVAVIVMVYIIFFSMGIRSILKIELLNHYKKSFIVFFGVVIVMQAPLLLGGFWGQVKAVEYPADWYLAEETIKCNDGEQILFLPWHMYMSHSWHNKIIASPAQAFFTCPVITSTATEFKGVYDNSNSDTSRKVEEWMRYKGENKLFHDQSLNIVYIAIAKDADWLNYEWIQDIEGIEIIQDSETLRLYTFYEKIVHGDQ